MFSKEIREKIKERDNNECQYNKLFGIEELSGVPCSTKFEIHHKTYKNARTNDETVDDGILVCVRCHDLITQNVRSERNLKKRIITSNYKFNTIGDK